MYRIKGMVLTVLLHSLLLIPAIRCTEVVKPPPPQQEQAKKEDLEIVFVSVGEEGEKQCDASYVGIGVMNNIGGVIIEVASRSPAEKAGLRVGDIFLNADEFYPDRYTEGTTIVVRIERDGRELEIPIKVGKVCYS